MLVSGGKAAAATLTPWARGGVPPKKPSVLQLYCSHWRSIWWCS